MSLKDGGPAFPFEYHNQTHGAQKSFFQKDVVITPDGAEQYAGMTLRDYFAAKAMQGFCADPGMEGTFLADIARQAYAAADAMLEQREK